MPTSQPPLRHPFTQPPEAGHVIEAAPGVLWTRLPLPFRLDHVNIYLIEDDGGWAVLDAGLGTDVSREIWEQLAAGPLAGLPLTRLIVSHSHPDHIGLAGWLCDRFGIDMATSQTAWLGCLNVSLSPGALDAEPYHEIYLRNGLDPQITELVSTLGHRYLKQVTPLPPTFRRIVAGDTLHIGGRDFAVLTGDGHAAEQVMLYCAEDRLFFAADQVLAKITPNVSVWPVDPQGDPLGLYLRSLKTLKDRLPEDVFVLPGHQLPFHGLHRRCDELVEHHTARCAAITEASAAKPCSVAELVPVLFPKVLDPHQLGFAFSETQAHVNRMVYAGELAWSEPLDGIWRVAAAS